MQSPSTSNALERATVRGAVVQAGTVTGGVHLYANAPATVPTPREPPDPPAWWTDRAEDLTWCDAQYAAAPGRGALIVVLAGPRGVGTSALAARWLQQHAEDFPDGQLSADFAGQRGVRAAGPIALRFLTALGRDPGAQIPDLDGLAALLRTATRARRLAVLLDGVDSAAQIRPLLPAGTGCVAIITTRHRLEGLAAYGARTRTLGSLPIEAGCALLETALGTERVATDRDAAEAIARCCAGSPLALTVAAAHLATRPQRSLAVLAAQLAAPSDRLDQLTTDGERTVTQVLDNSYRGLPPAAARLYRLLGALPVPLVDTASAAALLGGDEPPAQRLLDTLAGRHLLEPAAAGDYRIPELVHLHAQGHHRSLDARDREDAARRYGEFLLAGASAAEKVLTPTHHGLLERTYTRPPRPIGFPDGCGSRRGAMTMWWRV
jgi:hypothetical protein